MTGEAQKALRLSIAYTLMLAICAAGFLALHHQYNSAEPVLPEPGPRPGIPTDNLDLVLATAALHGRGQSSETVRVSVPREERDLFREHLKNIAPQRGWFISDLDLYGMTIVMPTQDLAVLEDIRTDPIRWAISNINPGAEAAGPASTDLTKVRLQIGKIRPVSWYIQIASMTMLLGGTICAGLSALACYAITAHEWRRA